VNAARMRASLSEDMLATDLAEYLVRKGVIDFLKKVPFRETHHISGQAVQLAESRGCSLSDLTLQDLKSLHNLFDSDVYEVWDFERSIEQRCSVGGTSRKTVLLQTKQLKHLIGPLKRKA
jgi:argininosuccinate lyase